MTKRKVFGNKAIALVAFVLCAAFGSFAADADMPGVAPAPAGGWKSRGMVIAAPMPKDVGRFCSFIKDTLKPAGVDTLVLLVRYRYTFTSHPECVADNAISLVDTKAIKAACDAAGMRLIPKMNLLGHQSGNKVYAGLLKEHPELDESPEKEQVTRNYCRSICPTHPDSKRIVCEMLDELVAAFGADMVHIGCDEVFEIGNCPRCRGTATAKLFADWVNGIAAHLKEKGVGMMMWGDRLLDSKTTGYGVWEASDNGTSAALGKVSKDVVICDWHYESKKAYPSVEVFADAGYKIYLCPWRYAENAQKFLAYAVAHDKGQYLGFLFTTWCACEDLMDVLEGKGVTRHKPDSKGAKTLVALRRNFRYLFPAAKGTTPRAFDAALTDPLAWLYADSTVASAERLDEIDVPANGVIVANNLYFICDKPGLAGNVGLLTYIGDSHFTDIVVVDYTTGIRDMKWSNRFTRCHVWGGRIKKVGTDVREMLENSVAFDLRGSDALLMDCYADTAMTGFWIRNDARIFNCAYFNNWSFKMDNPTVFRHEKGNLIVTGGRFSKNSPKATLYSSGKSAGGLVWHDNNVLAFTGTDKKGLYDKLKPGGKVDDKAQKLAD